MKTTDPCSHANHHEVRITHIDFNIAVSFESQRVSGEATYTAEAVSDAASRIVLDCKAIAIEACSHSYTLGPASSDTFGQPLSIEITQERPIRFSIRFETTPSSSALQWLTPQQTAGKTHPFMFSQCQAIHARSLYPCQDTPAVKFTYTATVRVPRALTCVMSAVASQAPKDDTFFFSQPIAIPSYLVAIAVGNIASKELGPRTRVYSEPEMIGRCYEEFADSTEKYLSTAIALCGPYEWSGRYDFIVLPPSFPYGGMENPNITFVTPTLLAGDKSLTDVVAHEVTHSWTGNLVGCRDWRHFWLNEGFTRFIECKIVGRFHNDERLRHLSMISGYHALEEAVSKFGAAHAYTKLVLDIDDDDPDDSFSSVPYEKGCLFLYYLETRLGGRESFEGFLKAYIARFRHQAIGTDQFKQYLYEYFAPVAPHRQALDSVDWDAWLHGVGMLPIPFEELRLDQSLAVEAVQLAQDVLRVDSIIRESTINDMPEWPRRYSGMMPPQRIIFLQHLLDVTDRVSLCAQTLDLLDRLLHLSQIHNAEITKIWLLLGLKHKDGVAANVFARAEAFLGTNGRMKYVRPVFRAYYLVAPDGAVALFRRLRASFHPICAAMLAKDLHVNPQ